MLTTTLAEIKKHNPCTDGWAKLRRAVGTRKPLSTVVTLAQILESNGLDDAIWALRAFPDNEREVRLFACSCACHVANLNTDVRVRRSIETAALFAGGLADTEELAAAWAAGDAARAAARDAAWAAAGDAARDAAWAAAWAAAGAAAGAAGYAAWAAAGDAARNAERSWQLEELLRMCRSEGIYAPLEDCTEWQKKFWEEG